MVQKMIFAGVTVMHHIYFYVSFWVSCVVVISPGNCSESYETRTQFPTVNTSTPSSNISSPQVSEPKLSYMHDNKFTIF